MSLMPNERTKLLASALNNTAVAIVVTGIVAPFVAFIYGSTNIIATRWWPFIGAGLLLLGVGGITYSCTSRPWETQAMTDAQIYLLASSFVVFLVGLGGAYYWIRRVDREERDTR